MKTDEKVGKEITKEEKVMNQSVEKIIAYVEKRKTSCSVQLSSVQSLSHVQLFATP